MNVITELSQSCFLALSSSKKNKETDDEATEEETRVKTVENGSASEGVYNMSFSDDERFTQM